MVDMTVGLCMVDGVGPLACPFWLPLAWLLSPSSFCAPICDLTASFLISLSSAFLIPSACMFNSIVFQFPHSPLPLVSFFHPYIDIPASCWLLSYNSPQQR